MTKEHRVPANPTRRRIVALGAYLAIVLCLIGVCISMVLEMSNSYRTFQTAEEQLANFERRVLITSSPAIPTVQWPAGSPFLEGQTVTLASAALLQHLAAAIIRADGSMVSSEIEPEDAPGNNGYLRGSVTFEIAQTGLQSFLYDVEAGMPFLFVEQLLVNASSADQTKLKVFAQLSGRWVERK